MLLNISKVAYHLPILFKTLAGYIVTKEMGIETIRVEHLCFIYHLYSECLFGPFTSARAPKWSGFKMRKERQMVRNLRG